MGKLSVAVMLTLTAMSLSSCSIFGFEETSVPVIASHSGEDTIDESNSRFYELSKPEKEESKPFSHDELSSGEFSLGENKLSEEASVEVSEPLERYSYKKFMVNGFSEGEISDIVSELTDIVDSADAHISIYYEDIATGNSFSYDGARTYKAGGVTMAPYVKYLTANGENSEETLTLKAYQKQNGSGILKNVAAGTEYTVAQLIDYVLRYSDNTAYKMLYDRFGFDGFNGYCEKLGVSLRMSAADVWGDLCADDAGKLIRDIYDFSSQNNSAAILTDAMVNTSYTYLIPSGLGGIASAHKSGYMSGRYKALHDAGIVYAKKPYIVIIMTDFDPLGGDGKNFFTRISSKIKSFAVSR